MVLLQAFGGVLSLLLVVGVGYVLAGRGWFPPAVRGLLPKLVTNVALPPFLMCTILRSFGREDLWRMLQGTLLPLLAMVLMYALAYAVGRAAGVERRHFGLFCACVSNPNTIFIGIPVNMALFGEEAVAYVLLYYFASTSFFWTVGNYAISRDERAPGAAAPRADGDGHPGGGRRKALVSAPVFGFLAGISLALLHVELPGFLLEAARLVGSLTTPLALIYIGVTLHEMDLRHLRVTRDMALALTGRMVASPLLVWALLPLFGLPSLMGKVFVMQASLPVLMQVAILSGYYNTDPEFGSLMVSLSTLACAVTIPVYMLLLSL
ncbi:MULTISPECIES: AEC family transporter [unclassified Desulfovibrio]|uniref:AEC family transporter n=1 Tax=unclassified Desulfovibrio TaxID=2593640 RepID=UPI0013EC32C0|nr:MULTISPECIES: AEC family transporter [unclassified Desulfovibrio]